MFDGIKERDVDMYLFEELHHLLIIIRLFLFLVLMHWKMALLVDKF